ncbi:hypothetical protein AB3N04_01390 [Alkalihalophilus sp. As8PL]|uniref:Helix-turn-helix domain-containing protein n=1 Tax=Alkalihalophilus sp. As8PL TaxID=3237103 RepID=A0AB39BTG3_9BACI
MDGKRGKCRLTKEEIVHLYSSGHSTSEISQQANVSARYISKVLNEMNVERRPHGSWKRKYTLNEDYFKHWSNSMAYIIGFFLADGTV